MEKERAKICNGHMTTHDLGLLLSKPRPHDKRRFMRIRREQIPRYSVAAVCSIVALTCALGAWQMAFPLNSPTLFPFSETYYSKAIAADDPVKGLAWAQDATRVAPARAENWLLIAYCYQRLDKAMTPRVFNAIRHSYDVAPLAPDAQEWRLSYVYGNWAVMPADLRKRAHTEALAYSSRNSGYAYLSGLVQQVSDPEASMSLAAIILKRRATDYFRTTGNDPDGPANP